MPATAKSSKVSDLYAQITAKVVAAIKSGIADPSKWKAPWSSTNSYPTNALTGRPYRGGNVIWFMISAEDSGFETSYWATYKQWAELGRQVEAKQKGTSGVKWVFPTPEKVQAARAAGAKAPNAFPATFSVFNFAQTLPIVARCLDPECKNRFGDPLSFTDQTVADSHEHETVAVTAWELPPVRESSEVDALTLEFFNKVGADVRRGSTRAAFSPVGDYIVLPSPEDFTSPEAHCSVTAHEHTHWTGHKDRLDRDLNGRFGSAAYAAEELVAEMGAAFLCGQLGVCSEPREDHAHYLKDWLSVLQDDDKALYHAASLAQKAVDYLFDRSEQKATGAA